MAYTAVKDFLQDELDSIRESGLYKDEKIIRTPQGAEVDTSTGHELIMCANNYLGLADSEEIEQAVVEGLKTHGFGMASVRFICGTQDIHKELEDKITNWFGTEATILYTSCFDANTGLFETVLGPEDAIISDALNHASIIDGVRLCKAIRKVYGHNDMAGPGGQAQGDTGRPLPHDRHRRRLLHAGRRGRPREHLRPRRQVRRHGDGGRLPRDGLSRPDGSGKRRQAGGHRPRRRDYQHDGQGPRRCVGRLHDRPQGDHRHPAPALTALPVLQYSGAADSRRRAHGSRHTSKPP